MPRTLATADIGSNTVHLLIAETDGRHVQRLANRSEWLALGESVARRKTISESQTAELISILKEYRQLAAANRADEFYVFATEAVRSANNHEEVLKRIQSETKLRVDVIEPRREAEFSLRGSLLDCQVGPDFLFFEVGGGSAQVALVAGGAIREEFSLPLGTGRIVAEAGLENPCPPESVEAARRYIRDHFEGWLESASNARLPVLASGGVVRGLWRAVHPDGERDLAIEEVRYVGWAAARLTVSQIAMRFACKLKRAATLLPGAIVYEELMRHAGCETMFVSELGVREGAILAMHEGSHRACPA